MPVLKYPPSDMDYPTFSRHYQVRSETASLPPETSVTVHTYRANSNWCAHIRSRLRRDGRTLVDFTCWLPTHQRGDESAVNSNKQVSVDRGIRQMSARAKMAPANGMTDA
jgi:hypothetical protein